MLHIVRVFMTRYFFGNIFLSPNVSFTSFCLQTNFNISARFASANPFKLPLLRNLEKHEKIYLFRTDV